MRVANRPPPANGKSTRCDRPPPSRTSPRLAPRGWSVTKGSFCLAAHEGADGPRRLQSARTTERQPSQQQQQQRPGAVNSRAVDDSAHRRRYHDGDVALRHSILRHGRSERRKPRLGRGTNSPLRLPPLRRV